MPEKTNYTECKAYGCNKKAVCTMELEHEDGLLELLTFCKKHSESMGEDDGFLGWKIIGYWEYVSN